MLSVDGANALVLGLKLQNESNVMEKGDPKNDDGARRNKGKNLDQLGPKTLRAQGVAVVTKSKHCPSQPLINHVVLNKDVTPNTLE